MRPYPLPFFALPAQVLPEAGSGFIARPAGAEREAPSA